MTQRIDETVSVAVVFADGSTLPRTVRWSGRDYKIQSVGLHHSTHRGDDLVHVFGVVTDSLWMRLEFETVSLSWKLIEINDGQAN